MASEHRWAAADGHTAEQVALDVGTSGAKVAAVAAEVVDMSAEVLAERGTADMVIAEGAAHVFGWSTNMTFARASIAVLVEVARYMSLEVHC